ncbi:sec24-like protein [Vararia minispora EC-137]|uniref:Sec24-like protein n=1 Tax=Vararia minispora EC-137 TaxID=1314806 RepID=A0ACB8QWM5_9AGAM|nr:sec24-like protein [Vararia minispora EC-137]
MYSSSTKRHILPPPHTAGISLKGLRTHIEPSQVPSPTEAIEADREKWESQVFYTLPGTHVPLSTTDYVAIDQGLPASSRSFEVFAQSSRPGTGNSSPKFIRLSTYSIPSTSRLAEELSIPLAAVIQPFADLDPREEPVPVVAFPDTLPPRCAKCRAYINPWVSWVAGGNKWRCNLCGHETEVASQYFAPLDNNLVRQDYADRVELRKGTVDFSVPSEEYWASQPPDGFIPSYSTDPSSKSRQRAPEPMRFCFLLEVTNEAIQSGFLHGACLSLKNALYGYTQEDGTMGPPCFPDGCTLAIVTFDSALHFYDLSPNQSESPMLFVPDVNEPFAPLPSASLYVGPSQSRTVIEQLLDNLADRHSATMTTSACFGSAIQACLSSLAHHGGHIVSFVRSMPNSGYGALQPRTAVEESQLYDTNKEKALFSPRLIEWGKLADQCGEAGVGVSIFMAPSSPVDVASIGVLASTTGGDLFLHPLYKPVKDGPVLGSQLRRLLSRTTNYNCSLRIRSSTGIRIDQHYGNFYLSEPSTPSLGILDADKAITCTFSVHKALSSREYAFFQAAILYTTVQGERLVRVINLAAQIAELAGNVFRFADMDAVTTYLARHGRNVSADMRNLHAHWLASLGTRQTMFYLYPRVLALHDLDDKIALPDQNTGVVHEPSLMRASHQFMEAGGLYLVDNEEVQGLWVGAAASPQLLLDVFGVDDLVGVDPYMTVLPTLQTRLSLQIRNVFARRLALRGGCVLRFFVTRQNMDAAEIEFADLLVEDHNNASLAYTDYLSLVHKQISAAIQNGTPLNLGTGLRAPW